ncbi:hypothetical protein HZH66_005864 [Vespula vulgaris]|uniref:Uncharacterized protein n=1 Tax=Vespula vulgaris TaxID=7454 RepID=A0A834N8G4_VESVU|nr:hypothetical protein HZH66_005864 [Vespula vulgaris]
MIFPERRLKSRSVTDVSSGPGYSLIQTSYVFWFVSLAKIGLGNVQGWVLVVGQQLGSPEQEVVRRVKKRRREEEEEDTGFTSLLVTWKFNGQIGIRRHEADLMRSNSSCKDRLNLTNAHSRPRVDELGRAGAFVTAKVAMVTLYFSFPSVPTGSSRVSNVYDVYVFT